jgi:hypothetical protein
MSRSCLEDIRAVQCSVSLAVLGCGIFLSSVFRARSNPLTNVQTVFVIMMENHNWAGILGNTNCPYINDTLLPLASRAEEYFTPTNLHPSEPNYLWIEAGTNFGIFDDGLPAINHIGSTNHLVTLLESAGVSWKTYQESYQSGDSPFSDNYPYTAHHNPFIFFDDVATNAARLTNHVRPYSELASDLQSNTVARYNFITPNLTNDMHDPASGSSSRRRQGDDWLAREAPKILTAAACTNNGALFIVWDEGDEDLSDGPIGLILVSPLAKGRGYTSNLYYTHSSLLRTLQEIFGVGPLLGDAANASNLSDLFLNAELRLAAFLNPMNGLPQLTLTGLIAGKTNVIQSSSNLANWLSLSTNVATTNALRFTDAANTNGHLRFYRAWEFR